MENQNRNWKTHLLVPPHLKIQPNDLHHFIETDEFVDDWEQLGFNIEEDLTGLQILLMLNPEVGKLIKGTGGLRKMRFAKNVGQGKSSGARICYAYFPMHWTIFLVMAYSKNEKDNLSKEECNSIRDYLYMVEKALAERNY